MMNKFYTLYLLLSLLLSACVSSRPAPVETIPTLVAPTSMLVSETKTVGYFPLSTRTGVADVDVVIAAVESGDPQQLRDLIRLTAVGCTKADGLGGPPKCQGAEAEGTLVNVLPMLGPEGHFLHEEELSSFPGVNVIGIYAAYQVAETAYSEEAYPAGEYAVMFKGAENRPDVVFQIRDGIVRIDYLYSPTSLDDIIQRDAAQMLLIPRRQIGP